MGLTSREPHLVAMGLTSREKTRKNVTAVNFSTSVTRLSLQIMALNGELANQAAMNSIHLFTSLFSSGEASYESFRVCP